MKRVCVLLLAGTAASAAAPSYSKEVSRILQKHCEGCHRPGQIGPVALTGYEQASAFAPEIKRATQSRKMPPWKALPDFGPGFRNERRLTDQEIETLARWADAGAPRGDPRDLPPPVRYNDDWYFGTPDVVLSPGVTFELGAEGLDEFRCFVLPTDFGEDRTIQTIEFRPGNRKVVHHILSYTDVTGRARQFDATDPRPGYTCKGNLGFMPQTNLGGWAPGDLPTRLPDDMGRYLPKGADIVMQVHYHKYGKAETDRTSMGISFNRQPVKKYVRLTPVLNTRIKIPAGEANYRDTASWTMRQDALALSVFPHMHLLGKEMIMTATLPDGSKQDLIRVRPYDFNWQTNYSFREPIPMPKGTRIDVTAWFDNSENNPSNPNKPLREVRWGDATTDEMLIGWISYAIDTPTPSAASSPQ